jgi:hypothetical protein
MSGKAYYDRLPEENDNFLPSGEPPVVTEKPRSKRPVWLLFTIGNVVVMVFNVAILCFTLRQSVFPKTLKPHYSMFLTLCILAYD